MLQRHTRKITLWMFVIGERSKEVVGEKKSSRDGWEAFAILRNLKNFPGRIIGKW